MKENPLPKKIGRGLAYLQDTVDRMVTFGFEKLKKFGEKKRRSSEHPVENFLQNTSAFIGEMGTEFYRKYSEIKEERKASGDKKKASPRRPRRKT